jgi:hypothetical protein
MTNKWIRCSSQLQNTIMAFAIGQGGSRMSGCVLRSSDGREISKTQVTLFWTVTPCNLVQIYWFFSSNKHTLWKPWILQYFGNIFRVNIGKLMFGHSHTIQHSSYSPKAVDHISHPSPTANCYFQILPLKYFPQNKYIQLNLIIRHLL